MSDEHCCPLRETALFMDAERVSVFQHNFKYPVSLLSKIELINVSNIFLTCDQ